MTRTLYALWLAGALIACDGGGAEETPAETPPSKCPKVSMDTLSGQWIQYAGNTVVKQQRFEVVEGGTELWYTGGGFTKRKLKGEKRANDFQFDEVLEGDRASRFQSGSLAKVRLYVEPRPKDCSLRVSEMSVENRGGKEMERPKGTFTTYVEYPSNQPMLTFRPCTDNLFVGEAARDRAIADKQLEQSGAPEPAIALDPALPTGAWIKADADGDTACTYDMDLFFDDAQAKNKDGAVQEKLPAGEVVDGYRPYYAEFYAPFSGNHHLQIYRYRTCADGTRELVGVACLESILQGG
ncbi:MAG: hypothetical protein AAFV53_20555 [Myxococcota bacterium]